MEINLTGWKEGKEAAEAGLVPPPPRLLDWLQSVESVPNLRLRERKVSAGIWFIFPIRWRRSSFFLRPQKSRFFLPFRAKSPAWIRSPWWWAWRVGEPAAAEEGPGGSRWPVAVPISTGSPSWPGSGRSLSARWRGNWFCATRSTWKCTSPVLVLVCSWKHNFVAGPAVEKRANVFRNASSRHLQFEFLFVVLNSQLINWFCVYIMFTYVIKTKGLNTKE